MTPEAQRIAIAEAVGLEPLKHGITSLGDTYDRKNGMWINKPDYLNDLNAMHEAEKVIIIKGKWLDYVEELERLRRPNAGPIHATAAQRAEAFLRTIGKWEEARHD